MLAVSYPQNPSPEYNPGGQQPYGQQPPQYGQPPAQYGGAPDPQAPYGRNPVTGEPLSDKQKLVAGLLQLFLGGFGVGRFYLGYTGIGIAQLLTCGGLGIWALIDAILILVGKVPDAQGRPLRD
ncbi:TM2 domain-containing protein [Antrihabitans stalactiti]|uniref:TM2 domain-containing protein n=1 Tax=Antrihabitans stalactiti TaxID=2584121 RepID=A0A848KGP0_9NOCA|nr:TM2 domain-containing protein [Antrihabitans stalactiti]NMN97449.1 TM2 domain-containing protein [Antrihabitans stalactiti]